ncbi:unnamed protein product [Prorocentrum cordatum]|uniref:Uncharacterized protein n=1 Tax=Prorocentrum cordatum TaxID=2364126 RepID=A0ABN9THL4_9DINO|nr:unnamed protein product [Polarella glacialis]
MCGAARGAGAETSSRRVLHAAPSRRGQAGQGAALGRCAARQARAAAGHARGRTPLQRLDLARPGAPAPFPCIRRAASACVTRGSSRARAPSPRRAQATPSFVAAWSAEASVRGASGTVGR